MDVTECVWHYLGNSDGEGTGGEQAEDPHQRLWEVLHQHGEKRQAAKHHRQHGAHRAGKLGLLEQRRQHEGEKDLRKYVMGWK